MIFLLETLQTRPNVIIKPGIFGFGSFSLENPWKSLKIMKIHDFPKIPVFVDTFGQVWEVQNEKAKKLISEMKRSRPEEFPVYFGIL